MNTSKYIVLSLFSIFMLSCSQDTSTDDLSRPHDPWIFRSVLDLQPRMVTIALSDDMWAAYHTEDCALYKVWKGGVNFEGAVYTTAHGPQPISVGNAYVISEKRKSWSIKDESGQTHKLESRYKGHKKQDGHAVLMYELSGEPLAKPIRIEELVESTNATSGQPVFERTFTSSNVPENMSVLLNTNSNSIVVKENISTDGELIINESTSYQADNIQAIMLDADLVLNSNGSTTYHTTFLNKPLIANENQPESSESEGGGLPEGMQLIAKSDCKTCHNKNVQTIGPSYVAISKRYPTTDATIAMLTSKVKNGGTGVWGNQIMNPHPDLPESDIEAMVTYILSLDKDDEGEAESLAIAPEDYLLPDESIDDNDMLIGIITKAYDIPTGTANTPSIPASQKPKYGGVMPNLGNLSDSDFKELDNDFALVCNGYLSVEEDGVYKIRIWSDDGSIVTLGGKKILDNDGLHGIEYKEVELGLKKGYHPLKIEFFQGGGGKFLSLNWKASNSEQFEVIPVTNIFHHKRDLAEIARLILPMSDVSKIPGNEMALEEVHPSFTLSQARPSTFTPKVGGMDFFSDGRMAVSTWDAAGSVFILDNLKSEDPEEITVKKIADGLAEPLGLRIVEDTIYIMQKQELTQLVDTDGDDIIDEYRTLCDAWQVSANFHEFGFGLEYKDGYFYAALATAIDPGGASTKPQIQDRGKAIKISQKDGSITFVASGLRTPNGVGIGYNDEIFIADNQGDWLPSSKVVHVTEGAWFGSRSVDPEGTANLKEKKPVVWLPQDEIGNSPSTPSYLNVGPYQNQMIHGEVTHGGIKRVFVEEVNGALQGALFRFIQGLEAGVNRIKWSPDGALYAGGIGAPGNWGQTGKLWYGLQKLEYNGNPVFEMLAIRAKSDGIEIEFTEPLKQGEGWDPADYETKQWYYLPTEAYGGPKMGEETLNIRSVNISDDRKKVFLELDGMKEDHVIYVLLKNHFVSKAGHSLWSTEAWYTMNSIPQNNPGFRSQPTFQVADNTLSPEEIEDGWVLLFDGKTLDGWRNFKKQSIGEKWKVADGTFYFDPEGGAEGGDIITEKTYENFELNLEWRISNCGNSGIMFNVVESDEYDYVWQTGPEMQILDNSCHPDTRYPTHRAGDLYDMIETKYITVNPAGQWNKVRLISDNGKVSFWLNGYEVVHFEMFTDKWAEMIANSKFKDMPGFGKARSGHISLQDHSDKVWFKNVKIKEL